MCTRGGGGGGGGGMQEGRHLKRDCTPPASSFRPGPSNATAPRTALTLGVPRACISGVCAYSCHLPHVHRFTVTALESDWQRLVSLGARD